MKDLIQWVTDNPALATTVWGGVVYIARQILANAPAPKPGTWWAVGAAILKVIGAVIPTNKVDPVPTAPAPATTTAPAAPDAGPIAEDDPEAHPFLRRRIRAIAKRNGLDISEMADSDIDRVIDSARLTAAAAGGPIRDFIAWVLANPQVILALLQKFVLAAPVAPVAAPGAST